MQNVETAAEIFTKYGEFIYTIIRFKVGNDGLADDLFQNFFLSLVNSPPPPAIKNIKGYLYKAILNDIIDNARHVERYNSLMENYAEHSRHHNNEVSADDRLLNLEEIKKMIDYIDKKLEYNEARAINLRFKDDMKIKDVAERLGVNGATAWRYISKGLNDVRRFLRRS
ncbi:MAG: hypothetical protein A2Y12_12910 [Planctomycetes bacterium GWF2_42_9]|nr:MAG: hypothetical protein A2Y12_12910 [Planctomycetes bacterium GWF2_42_9]